MASFVRVGEEIPTAPAPVPWRQQDWAEKVEKAVENGVQHLLSVQAEDGYWVGELEADTTLESDYIYYLHVLGKAAPERIAKLANYVRRKQLPDGGWPIYPSGPSELNATCKAYFALKLAGDSADAPHMVKARQIVHKLGGLEHSNSYVRFYLALVGAVGWELVPAIPPELMLLPNWFYMNIYEMSSWTRGIVIPMAILSALRPEWHLPERAQVDELFKDRSQKAAAFSWSKQIVSWKNFFLAIDRGLKLYEKLPWKPMRQKAIREAKQWMLEHMERTEGLAAIYPSMMNSIFALMALGHGPDDPLTWREIKEFSRFEIEEEDTIRLQPCVSPVWDTCIAMVALEEAGLPADHPALIKAAEWTLSKQVLGGGDWQIKNKDAEPGGWAFEFRNDFYPDVDDTAFVLMSLQRVKFPDEKRMEAAMRRGIQWLLSMQNRDGGWGAFDRDNNRAIPVQHSVRRSQRDDRSLDRGRDRPRAGMPGTIWLARRSSGGAARREIPDEGSVQRRLLVWTLGRELRLWHQRRAARAGNGFADRAGILRASGKLAAPGAASGRELRRIAAQLRTAIDQRAGQEHALTDCLGLDRLAGGRRPQRPGDCEGSVVPGRAAESERLLERRRIHGHRIPGRVLSEVSPL